MFSCGSNTFGQCGCNDGDSNRYNGDHDDEGHASVVAAPDILAPRAVHGALAELEVERVSAGDDHSTAITAPSPDEGGAPMSAARAVGTVYGREGDSDADSGRSRVFTWGLNEAGQCAQGRAAMVVRSPQEAELLSGARTVGCGAGHTLLVL